MIPTSETLHDWMPIRFYKQGSQPLVDWCYMSDERFTHPFFEDTVRTRMRETFNLLFRHQTPIEALSELIDPGSVIPPTGFIFHMSRCGSTLVSQMLAASPANIVISEAPPIDSIIRSAHEQSRVDWLRLMIGIFGRRRFPAERNLFVKFDSWNTLDLQFIKNTFPNVPWIFLYRNPVEVIVSHMRQRGSQMVPGAMARLLPDLGFSESMSTPPEEYCARVLAKFCEAALAFADDEQCLLVNYEELPGAVTETIAKHFRTEFSPQELKTIDAAAQFDAKTPRLNFEPDASRKRAEASGAARAAAETWLLPLYENLEAMRATVSV